MATGLVQVYPDRPDQAGGTDQLGERVPERGLGRNSGGLDGGEGGAGGVGTVGEPRPPRGGPHPRVFLLAEGELHPTPALDHLPRPPPRTWRLRCSVVTFGSVAQTVPSQPAGTCILGGGSSVPGPGTDAGAAAAAGTSTITDNAAVATDAGRSVTGSGIPARSAHRPGD